MLLNQQAELVSFNSTEVEIALSPSWENMIKSRKLVIENALKKISGEHMKIKFSIKQSNEDIKESKKDAINLLPTQEYNKKKEDIERNISSKTDQNNLVDNSSKNLANFFNGEIIDLNE